MGDGRNLVISDVFRPITAVDAANILQAQSNIARNQTLTRISEMEMQDKQQAAEMQSTIGRNILSLTPGGQAQPQATQMGEAPIQDMTSIPTDTPMVSPGMSGADNVSMPEGGVAGSPVLQSDQPASPMSDMIQTPYGLVSKNVLMQSPDASARMLGQYAQAQEQLRVAKATEGLKYRREFLQKITEQLIQHKQQGPWQKFWETAQNDIDPEIRNIAARFQGSQLDPDGGVKMPVIMPTDPEQFKQTQAQISAESPHIKTEFLVPGAHYYFTYQNNKLTKVEQKNAVEPTEYGYGQQIDKLSGKVTKVPTKPEEDKAKYAEFDRNVKSFIDNRVRIIKDHATNKLSMGEAAADQVYNQEMTALKMQYTPLFERYKDMPYGWAGWSQFQGNIDKAISYVDNAGTGGFPKTKQAAFDAIVGQGSWNDTSLAYIARQTGVKYKAVETGGDTGSIQNNPLNIKQGAATQYLIDNGTATVGRKATDGGNFLDFKSEEDGLRAARSLLTSSYKSMTVDAALKRWSNSGYGGEIVPTLQNKVVGNLSSDEIDTLVQVMRTREGNGKSGASLATTPATTPKSSTATKPPTQIPAEGSSAGRYRDGTVFRRNGEPIRKVINGKWVAVS